MNNKKIGVVLVTFNRLAKLKKALQYYAFQDCRPAYIIVVDNASSDGTSDYLRNWELKDDGFEKKVYTLPQNIGGSGGFYEGLKIALEKDAEWIWVADDDAYPHKDCFAIANEYMSKHPLDDVSALCGMVLFDKKISTKHRRRTYTRRFKYYSDPVPEQEYVSNFLLNSYSFVGTILNKNKLIIAGLPKRDYFIWCDDSEHSLRMSKVGKIICLPQMRIEHDEGEDSLTISWKTYYGIRNRLDMIRSNYPWYFYIVQCLKFAYFVFRSYLINKEEGKLYLTALKDSLFNNFGLHKKYRPGWKIN